eukprot:TRINITY_DN6217_c0_g1_i1.p1 TRINITY_DN6217_c0_g1~~TRINITY_DN6217_c0_g1_i1.p1  ORF type:complete len:180 (+),score=43.86 TRINITY_DN6217_c0_g1_i1:62-601(+)
MLSKRKNPRDGIVLDEADVNPGKAFEKATDKYGPYIAFVAVILFVAGTYYFAVWLSYTPTVSVKNPSSHKLQASMMCGPMSAIDEVTADEPILFNRYRRMREVNPYESTEFKLSNKFETGKDACFVVYGPHKSLPRKSPIQEILKWEKRTAARNGEPAKEGENSVIRVSHDGETIKLVV